MRFPTTAGSVGLVGFGYYTTTVLDLLADAGTPAAFAVDDRNGDDDDRFGVRYALAARGIPILTADEFAQRAREPGLALVGGRIECEGEPTVETDPFTQSTAWVRTVSDGAASLAHPVALLDRVPPIRCPERYAVFGYPGSGNVLTQVLVAGLLGPSPAPPPAWTTRAGLAEHYFLSTIARIRALLAPLSPLRVDFYTHEFGRLQVSADCGNGQLGVAREVPCRRQHAIGNYLSHVSPTREAVEFLSAGGCRCVVVARHPCETLLSLANKTARPARTMLDNPLFLPRIATELAEWTDHTIRNRDRVRVVRYEDMAERNVDELKALADWLGRPTTDADASRLFDAHLNRNLPSSVPTHFFRGGNDKWRGEMTAAHLTTIREHVPAEAFTAFGYDVPTEADLTPTAPVPDVEPKAPPRRHTLMLETYPYQLVRGPHGIRVTGTDPDITGMLDATFCDPDLLALFAAGQWPTASQPLTAVA